MPHFDSQLDFFLQVLDTTIKSKGEPQAVYPLLQANLNLLDDDFAQVLRNWATNKLRELEPENARILMGFILQISTVMQQFPEGNENTNLAITIAGYEVVIDFISEFSLEISNEGLVMVQELLEDAHLTRFLNNILEILNIDNSNVEKLHVYLEENQHLLNDNFAIRLKRRVKAILSHPYEEPLESQIIPFMLAGKILDFSNFIQNFSYGSKATNLEIAIAGYESILPIYTQENFPQEWASIQTNMGKVYGERIQGNKTENLKKEIACYKNALQVFNYENFTNKWALTLNNLGAAYLELQENETENFIKAIHSFEEVLKYVEPSSEPAMMALTNLIRAYSRQDGNGKYLQNNQKVNSLNESIEKWEYILNHPNIANIDKELYWGVLNDSANVFFARYRVTKAIQDLERALLQWQQLKTSIPTKSSDLFINVLNNLGAGFHEYYKHNKNSNYINLLDKAIAILQQAKQFSPENSVSHYNLALTLRTRYLHKGDLIDLKDAITNYQQAIELIRQNPSDTSNLHANLNNLGNALRDYYTLTGELSFLEKAVIVFKETVDLIRQSQSPDKNSLAFALTNLGSGLRHRSFPSFLSQNKILSDRQDAISDIEGAINAFKEAVDLIPDDSDNLHVLLNNLAKGFHTRYFLTKNPQDLEEALVISKRAISVISNNKKEEDWTHLRDLTTYKANLGSILSDLYTYTKNHAHLESAMTVLQEASQKGLNAATGEELRGAHNWLELAFIDKKWRKVEQAYDYVYQASERLFQTQLQRYNKEIWLRRTQGVAAQAAYAFTKNNKLTEATIVLEQSLARLLSESLAINRADLTTLQSTEHAHFYNDYQTAVQYWEWAQQYKPEELKLARKNLDKVIEAIRQLEGYKNFLKPAGDADIQTAAAINPLVYIITTDAGGLALIVDKNKLNPVWLPELIEKVLIEKLQAYFENDYTNWLKAVDTAKTSHDALKKLKKDENATKEEIEKAQTVWQQAIIFEQNARAKWEQALANLTHWLWQTIMSPIIDALSPQSKVTLIPAGLLALLPLHAAWTHDNTCKTGKHYALDELTIRYAPNARALKEANTLAQQVNADKLLAIDNPSNDLATSDPEVQSVQAMFTDSKVLSQQNATQNAVLNALPDYNVLHFSCHGHTNFEKPLQSGLLMANKQEITLEELLKKHLKVRLATLSACETGLSGTTLPDEVVSLSSGLLQAGVAGVAASLWSVSEISTMMLMTRFYGLWQQKQLDPVDALQQAQQWVRDTTKEEKVAYFRQAIKGLSPDSNEIHLPKDTAKWLYYAIKDSTQDFSHPYHWAAFTYVGV